MTTATSENHLTEILLSDYPLPDEVRWGIADAGFVFATPDPGEGPAHRPGGQGRGGPGSDRDRQDGRLPRHDLHAPPPEQAGPGPPRAPRPRGGPDPGARGADPRRRRGPRPPHRPVDGRRLRRHGLPAPARRREGRAGHPRGHSGPPARLRAAGRRELQGRRDPGHRRGRPDVRHGVHPGPAADPAPLPAVPPPPDPALLGHPVGPRDGARLRAHQQRRESGDRARARSRARDHRSPVPRLVHREVPPAAGSSGEGGREPRPDLRQPPDDGGRPGPGALRQRLPDPGARRQRAAGAAAPHAAGLQGRQARRPRRDRRRVARAPHRERLARHQLRPPGGLRGLRPPDRADRAGRGARPGGLVRLRRLRVLARRDREARRAQDPGRVAAGEPVPQRPRLPGTARPRGVPRSRPDTRPAKRAKPKAASAGRTRAFGRTKRKSRQAR